MKMNETHESQESAIAMPASIPTVPPIAAFAKAWRESVKEARSSGHLSA